MRHGNERRSRLIVGHQEGGRSRKSGLPYEIYDLSIDGVPWHAMWGMRNRLIHDDGNTDFRIVFKVVHEELPGLRRTLEAFLTAESKPPAVG